MICTPKVRHSLGFTSSPCGCFFDYNKDFGAMSSDAVVNSDGYAVKEKLRELLAKESAV